ncbi:E3 ubiquitin/ISG15 ligase TRIM25-like [Gastrophryne carolinensis]
MASADLKEDLTCSVCTNIYNDPVTLPCGHNFCRKCIVETWKHQDEGESRCPECMRRYKSQPDLVRNVRLCSLSERFPRTSQQATEEIGITCSHCITARVPAVKSCLRCEVALCVHHLGVHSKSPSHIFTDPTTTFECRKCSVHNMILEYHCTEDDAYICVYCRLGKEHVGHTVQSLSEVSNMRKEVLNSRRNKMSLEIEKIDKKVECLQERERTIQEKATKVTDLLQDIRMKLELLEKRVLEEISKQQKQSSISELIQKQEIRRKELSRKMRKIEKLWRESDPMVVLQDTELEALDFQENPDEEPYAAGGLDEGPISQMLHTTLADIAIMAKIRFNVQETSEILLDVDTAANNVVISDHLKMASWSEMILSRSLLPRRFQNHQVLSIRSFSSGRQYWELETSGKGSWRVGMAYTNMARTGHQSWIGNNEESWCLCKTEGSCWVMHNTEEIEVPHGFSYHRIRIYLDYEAGTLTFYELEERIRCIHSFTTIFTEPLHIAIWVHNSSVLMLSYQATKW